MGEATSKSSSRKPPEPGADHQVITEWIRGQMPELQPILIRLDELIREVHPQAQFALKWKKAYYGLPERGWIIELVAYDVSVNAVFLAGAEFPFPPPLGDRDPSRYIKLHSVDEVDTDAMRDWIEQAGNTDGWH